jgi:hypothetical protein
MAAPKLYTFTVEGNGEFPYDMLRYDQCWPKSEASDVYKMSAHPLGNLARTTRSVTLVSIKEKPTVARWESFGWKVVM